MIEALSLADFDLSSTLGTQSIRTQSVQGAQAIQGAAAAAPWRSPDSQAEIIGSIWSP